MTCSVFSGSSLPPCFFVRLSMKAGSESRRLLLPVEDQRAGNDNQRGPLPFVRVEQGQNLYGLSESHVVRKAASESKPPEKPQPGQPVPLVVPQCAGKGRRRLRR